MENYNARLELRRRATPGLAERLVDELADHHPAVGRTDTGHIEVVITLPAETLRQAVVTALALVTDAAGVEVMTTAEFDRRLHLPEMPDLVSVGEAAELLGVSRQAVHQGIASGSLPARRVGKSHVLPRAAVDRR